MQINFKTKISSIALILVLTLSSMLVLLPSSVAQEPGSKNTFALIGAMPNPVGVGQEVLLWFGITDFTAWPQTGWTGLTIEVVRPDGETEILGPFETDTTGASGAVYTPAMTGVHYLQTHFPEQKVEAEFPGRTQPLGTIMRESRSVVLELEVQEDPIEYHPGVPLPSEFWTRPVDAQHREWAAVSGNWFAIPPNRIAPYNDAPETAHILWSKPLDTGGLIGGEYGSWSYEHGDAYQGKWANSVIINGVLYYNRFQLGFQGGPESQGIIAVDLRTGEELWFRNNSRLAFGQVVYWDHFNLHGGYAYIWETIGSTWNAYDAGTGEYIYSMINVPGGTNVYGPKGEILRYVVNLNQGWMALFNTTKAVSLEGWTVEDVMEETGIFPAGTAEFAHGSWIPFGRTVDASKEYAYSWNVTIPTDLPGSVKYVMEDRIIGSNTMGALGVPQHNPVFWAISTAPGDEGRVIFRKNWDLPIEDLHVDLPPGTIPCLEDGVFIVAGKESRQYWGFCTDTGEELWGPTEPEHSLNVYSILYGGAWGASNLAYGKLFTAGMAGFVHAYDLQTGDLVWTYEAEDPYTEILWSNNWPMPITIISDGKLYLAHQEHSGVDPRPRGAPLICLDVETGEEVFRIDGAFRTTRWGGQPIIGDSIIASFNTYDNQIYAIGKGPSSVEFSASPKITPSGASVLIEGYVTDVSPGTKDSNIALRFPNGVPAVADQSMSEWMKYVYMQFPRPQNIVGVDVVLSVIDPTGACYEIGTTTADDSGMFKMMYTPEHEGEYTVIASFTGSGAYWPSEAKTAFGVDDKVQPAPPINDVPPPDAPAPMTWYIIIAAVVVIVAVLAAAVLLKKRK